MTVTLASGDRALLHLVVGDRHATVVLQADPDQSVRALSHGMGFALSYWDRDLTPPLRPSVLQNAKRFAGQPTADFKTALAFLRSTLPAEATLRFHRRIIAGQTMPRWPNALRGGPPPPLSQSLWPFDPEVAGLIAGTRRLIKRDWLSPAQMKVDRAWLSDRGFALGTAPAAGSNDRTVLFAATSVEVVEAARRAETALCADDAAREDAAAWLGEALGYPACCRTAFERLGPRDDLSLAAELLPVGPRQFSPLTQWLHAPLALISHTPCSLECAPTRALAETLLSGLDAERPGFRERWLALARAVQLVDSNGRCFALAGAGEAGSITVDSAIELHADRISEAPEWVGRTLRFDGDTLSNAPNQATLIADHRGA